MAAGPDDQQLVRIVQHLAKLHLEIERGVRDPDQLTVLMRPETRLVWHRTRPRGTSLPGGPATDTDLGPVSLRRTADGEVFASVTTTTTPRRRGALTFVLHDDGTRVTVRRAQRIHPGRDYGSARTPATDQATDRLAAALDERRTVLAALEATERLAAEPHSRPRTPSAETWHTVLDRLDTEITHLMRSDLHAHLDGQRQPRQITAATTHRPNAVAADHTGLRTKH